MHVKSCWPSLSSSSSSSLSSPPLSHLFLFLICIITLPVHHYCRDSTDHHLHSVIDHNDDDEGDSSSIRPPTTSNVVTPEVMEAMRATFLPLFGFSERVPPPTLSPQESERLYVPDVLRKMYEKQVNFNLDTASLPLPGVHSESANTVRSFLHTDGSIEQRITIHKSRRKFRLKFEPEIPGNEKFKAAQIQIKVEFYPPTNDDDPPGVVTTTNPTTDETTLIQDTSSRPPQCEINKNESKTPHHRLLVYDIVKPGVKGKDGPILRLIDSKMIETRNTTINLDVTPAVERWLDSDQILSNHGVLVSVHNAGPASIAFSHFVLLTYTDDGRHQQRIGDDMINIRKRRAAKRHRKGHIANEPCRRRPMYVNFHDVGWSDWIVAPLGYDAYYCAGECEYPLPEHMNTTNHAIVQSLMQSVRGESTNIPKACCVPTQLSSVSMLYVDNTKKVILKNYKEMVVIGCGCR